jgi:hypothetical protein
VALQHLVELDDRLRGVQSGRPVASARCLASISSSGVQVSTWAGEK